MTKRLKIAAIAILLNFMATSAFAYDFMNSGKIYGLDANTKSKVELFVSKKIPDKKTALKYLNALKKYDASRFDSLRQGIYYYLI